MCVYLTFNWQWMAVSHMYLWILARLLARTHRQQTPHTRSFACSAAYLTLWALVLSAQIQLQIVGAGVSQSTKLFVCCYCRWSCLCCCCFFPFSFCSAFDTLIFIHWHRRDEKRKKKEKLKEHIEHDPYIMKCSWSMSSEHNFWLHQMEIPIDSTTTAAATSLLFIDGFIFDATCWNIRVYSNCVKCDWLVNCLNPKQLIPSTTNSD